MVKVRSFSQVTQKSGGVFRAVVVDTAPNLIRIVSNKKKSPALCWKVAEEHNLTQTAEALRQLRE